MADIVRCGALTSIALKKCGSSQVNRTFRFTTWEAINFPQGDRYMKPHYFTAVRNPGLRLVSCWNHLVKGRVDSGSDPNHPHKFGPSIPFVEWVDWVLDQQQSALNPHMRPQTMELADVLRQEPEGLIFIAMLEQLEQVSKTHLAKWLNRSMYIPHVRKQKYPPWMTHYAPGQLRRVREAFAADWRLWFSLYEDGHQIVNTKRLAEYLDLTNGIDKRIMP